MTRQILVASVVLLTATAARATDIVARAEATPLRMSAGSMSPRVERDGEGNVVSLRLNDMQLTQDDVMQVARLEHLRRLVLYHTKVSDRDVARLEQCQSLEHLNLTGTEITDESIDVILKLKRLRTVCLGDVNMTPGALDKLKALNRDRERTGDKPLRWGYSQRKGESR